MIRLSRLRLYFSGIHPSMALFKLKASRAEIIIDQDGQQ